MGTGFSVAKIIKSCSGSEAFKLFITAGQWIVFKNVRANLFNRVT